MKPRHFYVLSVIFFAIAIFLLILIAYSSVTFEHVDPAYRCKINGREMVCRVLVEESKP